MNQNIAESWELIAKWAKKPVPHFKLAKLSMNTLR